MLPPILLGLMVPFVAATYFLPEALQHVKLPLWLFLVFMFLSGKLVRTNGSEYLRVVIIALILQLLWPSVPLSRLTLPPKNKM